jgi:trehalose synthase
VNHRRRPNQHWVWRCHIDLSRANAAVWDFLSPNVAHYHAAIFSHVAFVPPLPLPAYLVPPSIDPLSDKNRELTRRRRTRAGAARLPPRKPFVTQVSRFDRIKDPVGVIEAFKLARKREDAHLVLAGGSADDDPEGAEVLREVQDRRRPHRHLVLLLPPDAHLTINALQRARTWCCRSRCARASRSPFRRRCGSDGR